MSYKIWGIHSDLKGKVKDYVSVPLHKQKEKKTARYKMKTQMSDLSPAVSSPVNPNDKLVTFIKESLYVSVPVRHQSSTTLTLLNLL